MLFRSPQNPKTPVQSPLNFLFSKLIYDQGDSTSRSLTLIRRTEFILSPEPEDNGVFLDIIVLLE